MKNMALAALSLVTALAGVAHAGPLAPTPEHGGVVAQVKNLHVELVAAPHVIRVYLRRQGRPVEIARSRAEAVLASGPDRQAVELVPAGDRLEATGHFQMAAGTVVQVMVSPGDGPAVTARFVLGP